MHGWVVVWKQRGVVCTQLDRAIKRWLGKSVRVGHAGTLDPFAEGILPIAFGSATRMIPFLLQFPKIYRFTCVWGVATDTEDHTGTVVATSPERPSYQAIQSALPHFLGEIAQRPCKYSAVKIHGVPAYVLARKGEVFDLPPKKITIYDLRLITPHQSYDAQSVDIEMTCSSGTYVRAFARDLADALGTVAHVSQLERVSVGPFSSCNAVRDIDILVKKCYKQAQEWIYPIDYGLEGLFPIIHLNQTQTLSLWNGVALNVNLPFFSEFWVCKFQGKMISLSKGTENRLIPYRCFVDVKVQSSYNEEEVI